MNKAVVQCCLLVMSSSLADMNFLRENDLTYSKAIAAMRDWIFFCAGERNEMQRRGVDKAMFLLYSKKRIWMDTCCHRVMG